MGHNIDLLLSLELLDIMKLQPFPILLKISHLPVNVLQGENKEHVDKVLAHIREFAGEPGSDSFEVLTQQLNFEIIKKLSIDKIEIYKIIFSKTGAQIFPEYELIELKRV
ncbi:hypothetical protein ACGRH2_26400 [Vibrio barjaei]|uniref:Uncharacterized protein n=1 Tax=Vibrio barjaei TaxID=1676683 RepID=A0ABW7IRV4_9VIBR